MINEWFNDRFIHDLKKTSIKSACSTPDITSWNFHQRVNRNESIDIRRRENHSQSLRNHHSSSLWPWRHRCAINKRKQRRVCLIIVLDCVKVLARSNLLSDLWRHSTDWNRTYHFNNWKFSHCSVSKAIDFVAFLIEPYLITLLEKCNYR